MSRRRRGLPVSPRTTPWPGEANFLLGMSEFYRGNFDKAYAAFNYLSTRLPLTEVYNNLGVVEAVADVVPLRWSTSPRP